MGFMKMGLGLGAAVMGGILVLLAVIAGVATARIVYINTFGEATQNARTNVTRNTNQYVTTQQAAMFSLMGDYNQATTDDQRAYCVAQIHNIASTLDSEDVPLEIRAFLAAHPRGSR